MSAFETVATVFKKAQSFMTRRSFRMAGASVLLAGSTLLTACSGPLATGLGVPQEHDASLDRRFEGICTDFKIPSVVYRDRTNGELFDVASRDGVTARIAALLNPGEDNAFGLKLNAHFDIRVAQTVLYNRDTTLGAHIDQDHISEVGNRPSVWELRNIERTKIHDVAMKMIDDVYAGNSFPRRPCTSADLDVFDPNYPDVAHRPRGGNTYRGSFVPMKF